MVQVNRIAELEAEIARLREAIREWYDADEGTIEQLHANAKLADIAREGK